MESLATPFYRSNPLFAQLSHVAPPVERFFSDPVDGQKYKAADYSQLLRLATISFANCPLYQGFEISKFNRMENPRNLLPLFREGGLSRRYDAIFFKKTAEQIGDEDAIVMPLLYSLAHAAKSRAGFTPTLFAGERSFEERKVKQKSLMSQIQETLHANYKTWGYRQGDCMINHLTPSSLNL